MATKKSRKSKKESIIRRLLDPHSGSSRRGYYSYESSGTSGKEHKAMITSSMNFAATEAYKLLRTNLEYSFADDANCHLIGVTSSIRGEGKSLTSVNTAFTIAQSGNRVLLLECDLRIPTVAKKMKLRSEPGISNILVKHCELGRAIQTYTTEVGEGGVPVSMDVLTAGAIPPNPSEMLGSPQMQGLVNELKKHYDYIIVDLPPVTAVTDALVVSRLVDGIVLVVRQNYTLRAEVAEAVRQMQLVNTRILGIVFNGASEAGSGYSKNYKYKYKYKYGYRYGYDSDAKRS